jgi:hypothetical protein
MTRPCSRREGYGGMTEQSDAGEPGKYATKARGRPFARGNPGKPWGARHKTTLAVEKIHAACRKDTRARIDGALRVREIVPMPLE